VIIYKFGRFERFPFWDQGFARACNASRRADAKTSTARRQNERNVQNFLMSERSTKVFWHRITFAHFAACSAELDFWSGKDKERASEGEISVLTKVKSEFDTRRFEFLPSVFPLAKAKGIITLWCALAWQKPFSLTTLIFHTHWLQKRTALKTARESIYCAGELHFWKLLEIRGELY
jgi:hypothetical protein